MAFTRADLNDLDKIWQDAGQSGGDIGEVPEGKYQAKVKEVELGKSSGGRPQCKFVFKIVGGVEGAIGKEVTTYDGLETPLNMSFFRRKLKRFGISPSSFTDLPEVIERCVNAVVEIQVKYKDDFLNIYINKMITPGPEGEGDEEEEEDEEEPKPKKKGKGKKKPDPEPEPEPEKEESEDESEDEDEDESEDESEEKSEDESEDESEEEEESRNFPTLDEIGKMKKPALRTLLGQFKIKPGEKKKESLLMAVSKALVSIMEDDDYEASEGDLRVTAKWLKLEPEAGRKKLLKQIIKKLGG